VTLEAASIPKASTEPSVALRAGLVRTAFLISGAVSLIYQVLWMRGLGLLFGNTVQAGATTITAFFLGLALGGWAAGALAPRLSNPLRAYGWVEIGVAAAALLYFELVGLYRAVYPHLFVRFGAEPGMFLLVKFALGVAVLLPASCLIGATLPLVGEHLLRTRDALGRGGTLLYAINTLGAVVGTYLAAFVLPLSLGFRGTYGLAIASNLALGVVILLAAGRAAARPIAPGVDEPEEAPPLAWIRVATLAFLSGVTTLALEVLWTRMFAQVLHNSVYTFAIILITFLAALALGSLVAHRLIEARRDPTDALTRLLTAGAILVAISPWLFFALTGGLQYLADHAGWVAYQATVFALAGVVILPATLLLGTVFPFLMKLGEGHSRSAGRTLGQLVALNTIGGILGSLLAGFGLLTWLGLWSSLRLVALMSLAGIALVFRPVRAKEAWVGAVLGLVVIVITGLARPPLLRLDPAQEERLIDAREGSAGIVAVVQNAYGLVIKVNNHYTLGGSASLRSERCQGMLPLLLHPAPRDVFYLGMGTGITAGAATLDPDVRHITVCELVPDVIRMSRLHFDPYTAGLYKDPRVRLIAEDGRNFLQATPERYDVIISDLFVPWEARAGSLYSLEHFVSARDHLKPGGLFAQWLPLYQLSRREFDIVANTMLQVFPHVTVWRGDLSAMAPTLALVGRLDDQPLDPEMVVRRLKAVGEPYIVVATGPRASPLLWSYAGNLSLGRGLVAHAPLNTDDRPLIEYLSPITHRRVGSHAASFLVGQELVRLYTDLRTASPLEPDPYLARLNPGERGFATAGYYTHVSAVGMRLGDQAEADSADARMTRLLPQLFKEAGDLH
jgi:spermidine synthase